MAETTDLPPRVEALESAVAALHDIIAALKEAVETLSSGIVTDVSRLEADIARASDTGDENVLRAAHIDTVLEKYFAGDKPVL